MRHLPWRAWSRRKEHLDLIDFTTSTWTGLPAPPADWSMLRLTYSRKPTRDFALEAEHRAWFSDFGDKGERWRARSFTT